VLDTARSFPDRFVAVCTLDPRVPDAPAQLTECVNNGAAGLRMRASTRTGPLDWLTSEALWQRAADLRLPVCVHFMEHNQAEGVRLLPDLLARFPTVPVVLDHVGNPPWRDGPPEYGLAPLLRLACFENLYLKFATLNLVRLEAAQVEPRVALEHLIGAFGASRIMWGSDAPNTPGDYAQMLVRIRVALSGVTDDEQRCWILGGTALRLYPRLAAA
jgi:L-fuconolactonase